MEDKFLLAWQENRRRAEALGVRVRPGQPDLQQAHRCLSGHRPSDGFDALAAKGRLDLSLEALAVQMAYTGLFTDDEANTALTRLMDAGYWRAASRSRS